jgi:hypothetical protein
MHSLQALFLHKRNVLPSIPVTCGIHRTETYENMKEIISHVNKTYQWHTCGDLKVNVILMSLQKVTQYPVLSYANRIVVPKVFTTARRNGLYVDHIHLEQRMSLISLV